MNAHANNPWRRFLGSLFRTPLRAAITIAVAIVILMSGVIYTLISALINTLLFVFVVLALFAGLYRYIVSGGKRH